jgi:hypothetical protein
VRAVANPDTDDGWFKLAHELDAALAVADFSKGARIVLREVFAQVFGKAKRRHAALSPSDLARRTGMDKSHVVRAIRELVDSGVLQKVGEGVYKFIKDYESWTRPGPAVAKGQPLSPRLPRLSKVEVAFAANAPGHNEWLANNSMGPLARNRVPRQATNKRSSGASSGTETVSIQAPSGAYPGTETVSIQAPTPIEVRAREFETGDLRETGDHNPSDCARAAAAGSPAPSGELNPGPGIFSPEAEALARWAEPLGGNWSHWARCKCNSYPAWWMKALLQRKVEGVKPPPREAMLNAILQGWKVTGCEYPDPDAPTPPASAYGRPAAPADRAAEKARRQHEDLHAAGADLREGR